jgi:hypothetical protein
VGKWLRLREGDRCAGSDCLALLKRRRTMARRERKERRERRRDMMSPPCLHGLLCWQRDLESVKKQVYKVVRRAYSLCCEVYMCLLL